MKSLAHITKGFDKQRRVKVFTHLIVILMLFILPDLIFSMSKPHWREAGIFTFTIYVKAAIYVVVFYASYYMLIPRTLLCEPKRRILPFVLWAVALIFTAIVLLLLLQANIEPPHPRRFEPSLTDMVLRWTSWTLREVGMLALIIGLSVALRLAESWSDLEKKRQEMLASQRAEELDNLKNQINPHFLFNTLNTIYALIAVSPDQAQHAVHELSTLLRHVLYENPQKVKLSQEIKFAQSYISLMSMRMGAEGVKAAYDMQADVDVPPLLFINLIENAFKHGNTGLKEHPIEISISSTRDGVITCHTSNFYIDKPAQSKDDGGIGIANLRRRLHLIYGDNASLEISKKDNRYNATLTIKT